MMLGQEHKQFEQTVEQENVHHQVTDEEIIAAETVALDPDSIQYMEAPVPEFENASTWAGIAVANTWNPICRSISTCRPRVSI